MKESGPIDFRWHRVATHDGQNPHIGIPSLTNDEGTFILQFRRGIENQIRGVVEWMEWQDIAASR